MEFSPTLAGSYPINIPTVAKFDNNGFPFEIFGQNINIEEQYAFRHLIIEYKILKKFGNDFKEKTIVLKNHGYKTEAAFAKLLNLKGDPYEALLNYKI